MPWSAERALSVSGGTLYLDAISEGNAVIMQSVHRRKMHLEPRLRENRMSDSLAVSFQALLVAPKTAPTP